MSARAARPFLYRQLTLRLMVPLLLIVAVVGAIGMYSAGRETATVFDRWLLDAAVSLADQVRSGNGNAADAVDLPEAARTMLAYDEIDQHLVQRRRAAACSSAAAASRPAAATGGLRGRAGVRRGRTRARRCAWPPSAPPAPAASTWSVLVAETMLKRERANRVVQWLLIPLGRCSWSPVRRSSSPCGARCGRWRRWPSAGTASRTRRCEPIAEDDLPHELSPFATALNHLLARLRGDRRARAHVRRRAAHQLRTPLTALRLGIDPGAQQRPTWTAPGRCSTS